MSYICLSLFGPFQLSVGGEPVITSLWTKTQALLAYLAAEADRPHRREFLAGLLWPDQSEEQARNSLRQALHQLQRAISRQPQPLLLVTAQTAQFNRASEHSLDVAEFSALLRACDDHPHRYRETCRACIERLGRAMTLYRGDFLSQLFLKDSTPFEEWAMVSREQFRQQALSTLRSLAHYFARRGEYERMAETAQRQLELDPFDEEAGRLLMQALAWDGRRNAALAQYEAGRRLLEAELGVSPEPETIALAEQIRSNTVTSPALPPLRNWPVQMTTFIGRAEEMAHLAELLQSPHARLVTLVGPGGVGKTRLALETATQDAFAFQDGACFVPLAAISDSEFIIPAIAQALQFSFTGSTEPRTQLLRHLREKELLLVLDNFEHLLPAALLVADILTAAPQVKILVTSRAPLRFYGEYEFPLPPLPLPDPTQGSLPDTLAQLPSVALFVARAQAIKPAFALTAENAPDVATICTRLDGLPLAIELAAAHARHLSPPELAARLNNRLATLTAGARNLPQRHRTLASAIDWSYNLLEAVEQQAFAQLGIFAGKFTLEAAEAVLDPSDDAPLLIESLIDKSLLQSPGERQLLMLETIHEFALKCLAAGGGEAQTRRRHAQYYLTLAEQADSKLAGQERSIWLLQLEDALDNIRVALRWSLGKGGDYHLALRLVNALGEFWYFQGFFSEGRAWFEAALAHPDGPPELRARALTHLGRLLDALDNYQPAMAHFEKALAIFQAQDDRASIAWTLEQMTHLALLQGQYKQANTFATESLALFRALGDQYHIALASEQLGTVALEQGHYAQAIPLLEESLRIYRELGSQGNIASALNLLGQAELDRGNVEHSLSLFKQSLAILQRIDQKHGLAWTLRNLGLAKLAAGGTDEAATCLRQTLLTYRELDSQGGIAIALEGLSGVASARSQPRRSARLLGAAAAIREAVGMPLSPNSRGIYERMLATAKAQLATSEWEVELAHGRTTPYEEAIAYALEEEGS